MFDSVMFQSRLNIPAIHSVVALPFSLPCSALNWCWMQEKITKGNCIHKTFINRLLLLPLTTIQNLSVGKKPLVEILCQNSVVKAHQKWQVARSKFLFSTACIYNNKIHVINSDHKRYRTIKSAEKKTNHTKFDHSNKN